MSASAEKRSLVVEAAVAGERVKLIRLTQPVRRSHRIKLPAASGVNCEPSHLNE